MLTVNLFDHNFPGQECSVANQVPTRLRYVRNQLAWDGISFYTDEEMFHPENYVGKYRFGWLHEGMALHPENYANVWDVLPYFDAIFTNEQHLVNENSKFWKCIRGGTWLPAHRRALYPKSKSVAMITSEKKQTLGHQMRHEIVQRGWEGIDHFGYYGEKIGTNKLLAYRDYRFALVVEAQRAPNFFSEHLLDALACGCIPIYWGCPNIAEYFRYESILSFETLDHLRQILDFIMLDGEGLYERWQPFVWENLKRVNDYVTTEDWIVEHLLEPYFGEKL